MRKLLLTFLTPLLLIPFACTNQLSKAEESAVKFLDHYFNSQFQAASAFCTPELGEELLLYLKNIEELEEGVREMIMKQTSQISSEIISVEKGNSKDSVNLIYKVYLPSFPNGIDNKMQLVRSDKEWLVAGFGQ